MIRILLITLIQLSAITSFSQEWSAFNQRIDVKEFRGKKFSLQAAVKVEALDPGAAARLWARVDRDGKKIGFFYNMMDKPIRINEWKTYSINGRFDKDADYLAFGGLYHSKGKFYFDDFKLVVENNGKMTEVAVSQGDFEGDSVAIQKSWYYLRTSNFRFQVTTSDPYSGKQSIRIDGSVKRPSKEIGNNSEAGRFVTVNGISMYYEIYGAGEPLLLLHGNSMDISSFKYQIPELAKKYKVIALDSRAQGKSGEDGKRFTYELFAEDTKAFLDALHIDSARILGWSDGGNTGLILAMKYPSKVKSLAIMGANLNNNKSSVKSWVNKELNKQLKSLDTTNADRHRRRMIDLLLHEPNISPDALVNIKSPVIVMAGSDDVIKEEHTKLMASKIPKATLHIFPKGNHNEPGERPERFNKVVMDFFAR